MDKQKAIQKIQACLNIYKCTTAPQGERDAAWERANHIAKKYGLKIVKQERKSPFDAYPFNADRYSQKQFVWEIQNANGKRVRDLAIFFVSFTHIFVSYRKESKNIFVRTVKNPEEMKKFMDNSYKEMNKICIRFTKMLQESLHLSNRHITGQKASDIFSICFAQLCRMGDTPEGKKQFCNIIPYETTTLGMLYSDLSKLIDTMRMEVNRIG